MLTVTQDLFLHRPQGLMIISPLLDAAWYPPFSTKRSDVLHVIGFTTISRLDADAVLTPSMVRKWHKAPLKTLQLKFSRLHMHRIADFACIGYIEAFSVRCL